ncbi:hypothetical protein HMSSN036_26320 [Paenibacillus macerans]|nr:hypothetical protein HMSSN036_26320 [Paenibacillus macerans]
MVKRSLASGGPYETVGTVTAAAYTDSAVINNTTYYYVITATNAAGESLPSAQVSAKPREAQTPAEGDLKVQYRNNDANAGDNQLRPHFRIVNTGDEAVPLSELTLRYYYTIDGDKSQQFNCDYAFIGSGNVSGRFVKSDSAADGSDYYLEVSFTPGAGNLAPGADSGEIQTRVNKTDWSNYNESDDYSYSGSQQQFADWDKVTLYRNGTLVWGVEP